ncbi:unnamed protein product [Bursaphelenchus okinawaensis]|uniref:Uncharacterized protein n=1 Tax=Bursaphelenchus okinawaensis TaxID=465554 RepID=A0A811KAY7_9BILA|nr:unnamed protein product [Bursaphelenchus okinawaensis]CAG9098252.1 unnamed protein product [Bursaphelenchus okinawaensis]
MLIRAAILVLLFAAASFSIRCYKCEYLSDNNMTIAADACLEPSKLNDTFTTDCDFGCKKEHVFRSNETDSAEHLKRDCSDEKDEVGCTEETTITPQNITVDTYTCVSKDKLSNSTATWSISYLLFFILYIGYYW